MAFLIGMGEEEPLRYRILPLTRFMNLGERCAAKLRIVPCAVRQSGARWSLPPV